MKNTNLQSVIRRATTGDAKLLAELGAATFTETFGHLYSREDLHTFLAVSHSQDAWKQKLSNSDTAVWIAMLDDATPIAFIAAGPCKLPVENPEPNAGEIQMLYVLKSHHNLRLGSRLMDIGLEWFQVQGRTSLYVGVWSENLGAQRFYGRYGFSKIGEYGFPVGETVDREFILKR
jgi:ribosomal protein S18 acetylase RimI-like enzyme